MGISDFVNKNIRFSSEEELREFLEITNLHHPSRSKGELIHELLHGKPNYRLQIVEMGNFGRHASNPAYSNTASYRLQYSSGTSEVEAADIITNLTKPNEKPLDTVDIFVMFLKNKCSFSEFCREFHTGENQGYYLSVGNCISNYLDKAFLWDSSKKGHLFWANLHDDLEKMIIDLNLPTISDEDMTKFLKLMERNKPKQEGV